MRDEKLWHDIENAPSALATLDAAMEPALIKAMRKEFGLDARNCAIALFQYRHWRYLQAVSEAPLLPPPLLAFIRDRDIVNSPVLGKRKWRSFTERPSYLAGSLSFVRDSAYQRAISLYRQEFDLIPMPEIWPDLRQVYQRNAAIACAFVGMAVLIWGEQLHSNALKIVGSVLFCPSILFMLFYIRHWGDPQGDR
jgi:hypothetical protein